MKKFCYHLLAFIVITVVSFDMKAQAVIEVTNPMELVQRNNKPCVIEFYSPQCPHCMAMVPVYEKVAQRFNNKVVCMRVNVLRDNGCIQQVAQQYSVKVNGVPTFVMVNSNGESSSFSGSKSEKELVNKINALR